MKLDQQVLGNSASEEGAAIEGADFSTLNQGQLPESRPQLVEADVEVVEDGVTVVPKADWTTTVAMTLREGPRELLDAQLVEEPDSPPDQMVNGIAIQATAERAMTVGAARSSLVWYGMHPDYYGAMLGDRIMVHRDVLESQYSCKRCAGKGFSDEMVCGNCAGGQKETIRTKEGEKAEVPCRSCRVMGYGKESYFSCGYRPCQFCQGSGWKNGIVIPEENQSQAITGIVVSLGPSCSLLRIGDRIIFSRFAGHQLQVSKTEDYIMMRESEALGILRQRT